MQRDLEIAIQKGNLQSVKEIFENRVEEGISVNFPINSEMMPLHMAIRENQPEIAAYLLERGANPELPDNQSLNAFDHAALMNSDPLLSLLLSHKLGKNLIEVQEQIAQKGDSYPEDVRNRIKNLCMVTGQDFMKMSDWSKASFTGVFPKVANIVPLHILNQKDLNGYAPVHYAVFGDKLAPLERLVEADANIQTLTVDGNSLLHFAALKGSKKMVDRLLELGLDPNLQNARGETPLHFAALEGNITALEIMMKAGGKLDVKNEDGISPLALVGASSQDKDPLKLNYLQLILFATASLDWLLQFGAYSGLISNSPLAVAARFTASIAMLSHQFENYLHPSPSSTLGWINKKLGTSIPDIYGLAIPTGTLILRNLFDWVDIPVRVYSIYYLGKSIMANANVCMKNLHRKQTVARNFFVHAVTAGHSIHSLAQKCYRVFNSVSPAVAESQDKKIHKACRNLTAKFHSDANKDPAAQATYDNIRTICDSFKQKTDYVEDVETDVDADIASSGQPEPIHV